MRTTLPTIRLAALLLSTVGSFAQSGANSTALLSGVIVESVEKETAPQQAGMMPGDVLVSWERSSPSNPDEVVASGVFRTPFDAQEFGTEQLPRGHTRIRFLRNGATRTVDLRPGYWRLAVEPRLDEAERARYTEATALEQAGKYEDAETRWRSLAQERSAAGDHDLAAWLLVRSTETLLRKRLSELKAAAASAVKGIMKVTEATKAILPQMDKRFDEALIEASLTGRNLRAAQVWEAKIRTMGGLDGRLHMNVIGGIGAADDARVIDAARSALSLREAEGADTVASATYLYALVDARGKFGSLISNIGAAEKALLERAVATYERLAPGSLARADAVSLMGRIVSSTDRPASQPHFRLAATIARSAAPGTWHFWEMLQRWADIERDLVHLREAEAAYREMLNLERTLERRWPTVNTFQQLAAVAYRQGNYNSAKELIEAGAAVLEGGPASPDTGRQMNNLATTAINMGDLAMAEDLIERSLAADPTGPALRNLPIVRYARGDLAGAEAVFLENLAIGEANGRPDENALANLGNIAMARGSFDVAEVYRRRLLALPLPDRARADSLRALAIVLRRRGDLDGAAAACEEALALSMRTNVTRALTGGILVQMGAIARDRGDLIGAERFYARSLEMDQLLNPGAPSRGLLLTLADLAIQRDQVDVAKNLYQRVLADSRPTILPLDHLHALHGMGRTLRRVGALDQSADYLRRAIDVLESTRGKIGGSVEAQAQFASSKTSVYRDFLDVLLLQGREADAFEALERARARALVDTMAERDLSFAPDLPDDLRTERTALQADYEASQATLARLDPAKDASEVRELQGRVAELRQRLDGVASRIRQASPGLAAVQYPQPLNWQAAQRALDAGTVLLSYSVSENQTHVFVVSAPALSSGNTSAPTVITIPVTATVLRQKVEAFRELIARRSSRAADVSALTAAGRGLYDLLIRPAESAIAANRHVLVSPDGPLSMLPFGALVRSVQAGAARFLVEWKPLTMVPSATAFAELKGTRRQDFNFRDPQVVAFGDPSYPQPANPAAAGEKPIGGEPELGVLRRSGFSPKALPASRREVEAIRRLFPTSSTIYLGADATEERAKQIGKGPAIIHFAAHGVLNDRRPLDSALILTVPGQWEEGKENGLLQAWEIFDHVRIDADLVTLSACDSGLGKELPGEGLMGLTRAFLFAGARSVVSSLWDVADVATADLMTTFYNGLKRGLTKDEALRSAQVAVIQNARSSGRSDPAKPFYWAAFQLTGDWK